MFLRQKWPRTGRAVLESSRQILRKSFIIRHAPCRNRTYNPVIKSLLLLLARHSISNDQKEAGGDDRFLGAPEQTSGKVASKLLTESIKTESKSEL
jgi:hypothetical protein